MEGGGVWLLWAMLALSLLYYLTNLRRRRCGTTGRPLPPGPKPLPVLGNLLDLRGDVLHHTLARLARVHCPVMHLRLGLATAVVVSAPDAARDAFTKHDRRIAARTVPDVARAARFAERSMIWLPSSDPRWAALRGIAAAHIFSPRGLASVRAVRERKVRELVAQVRERARAGREIDVSRALYGGVLNLVSNAFFSVDMVDVGRAESADELRLLMQEVIASIAKPNVSDLFPFLRPLDVQGWRRWATTKFHKVFTMLDAIIDRRLAEAPSSYTDGNNNNKHDDFLDVLLELMAAGKITRDNMPTILFDVFAGGSDALVITVGWVMAELLRNPSTMAKVSAEVSDVLGGKEAVDEPDMERLPYLQAVVKEAMRLHPVTPLMVPHKEPKGCLLIFNSWAIMRDPTAWDSPDEFVPERFMGSRKAQVDFSGKDFEFIPFGAGRRRCPGVPMVERVVPFILASLLHAFQWKLPDGMSADKLDVSEKFTTVTTGIGQNAECQRHSAKPSLPSASYMPMVAVGIRDSVPAPSATT